MPSTNNLVFTTQPTNGMAGTALGVVVVQVQDASGNLVTGSTASITISSSPAGVGGTTTVAAVAGVAAFNNLLFTASGSYTLRAASTGLTGATSNSFTVSRPDPFGRTLALVNGDLQFANGDFVMVAGRDDLLQGLNVMMGTPFASDIFNVGYGFDLLGALSRPLPPQAIQDVIRLNIVKSITTDNRIREVKEVVFDDDPHFYDLSPQSDPTDRRKTRRNFRSWQAIVVLRTVADTDTTLSLQGPGL